MAEETERLDEVLDDNDQDIDEWKEWGRHYSNNMAWGIVLIIAGLLFLLDTFVPHFHFHNWWAIFILVPGINMLAGAWQRYQKAGNLTRPARRTGFWGLCLILVAFTFFFNLDWGMVFAIFLIGGGVSLLLWK